MARQGEKPPPPEITQHPAIAPVFVHTGWGGSWKLLTLCKRKYPPLILPMEKVIRGIENVPCGNSPDGP